ncbi:MAG: YdbH domain-containing protein [Opitutales bacterium]|nr:YdbH domain-containing protein [Opitutales bacterium]
MVRFLKNVFLKSLLLLPGILLLAFLVLAFFRVPIAEKILARQFSEAGITVDISITDWRWGYLFIEELSLESEEWSVRFENVGLTHDAGLFTARKLNSLTGEKAIVHLSGQLAETERNDPSKTDLSEFLNSEVFFQTWPVDHISIVQIQIHHSWEGILPTPVEAFLFSTMKEEGRYLQAHLEHGQKRVRLTATRGEGKWWAEISTGIPYLKLDSQELSLGNWNIPSPDLFPVVFETFPFLTLETDPIDFRAEIVWVPGENPEARVNATTEHLRLRENSWNSRIDIDGFLAELHNPLGLLSLAGSDETWKGMIHLDALGLTTSFADINLQGLSAMVDDELSLAQNWGRLGVRSGEWAIHLSQFQEFLTSHKPEAEEGLQESPEPVEFLSSLLKDYPLEFAFRNQSVTFQQHEKLPDLLLHGERHRDTEGHFPLALRFFHAETLEQLDLLLTQGQSANPELRAKAKMEVDGFGSQYLSELIPVEHLHLLPVEGSVEATFKARWNEKGDQDGKWEKTITGEGLSGNITDYALSWKINEMSLASEGDLRKLTPGNWQSVLPQTGKADVFNFTLENEWLNFVIPKTTISLARSALDPSAYAADFQLQEPFLDIDINNWREFMNPVLKGTLNNDTAEETAGISRPLFPLPEIPFINEIHLHCKDGKARFTHWYNSQISLPWKAEGQSGNDGTILKVFSENDFFSFLLEYRFTSLEEEILHIEGEIQKHEVSTFWRNLIHDLLGIETTASLKEFVFAGRIHNPATENPSELGLIVNLIDFAIPKWDLDGKNLTFSALWSNIWEGKMKPIGEEEPGTAKFPLVLTFEELRIADLPFHEGRVAGIMENWDTVSVETASTSWRSANLELSPFSLNPLEPEGIIRLNFQNVPIKELLALFPELHTTGEGNLEGAVSFFASPEQFRILPGSLALPEGEKANLQIRYPGLFTGNLSPSHPRYELLRRAESGLENLVVEEFLVQLFRPEEPNTPIKLRIRTQALNEDILPFDLNFHIHGALEEILPLLLRSDLRFSF